MNSLKRKILESSYPVHSGAFFLPEKQKELFVFPDVEKGIIPPEWLILKNSGSVITFLDQKRMCFIKICRRNSIWKILKRKFCFPRPYRCLAGALRLKELQIPTPEVWYASRYELVTELLGEGNSFLNVKPEKVELLLDLIVRLHWGGVVHGDLNYRNMYRTEEGEFGLIDLDAVRLYSGTVPFRFRMKELGRLISSGMVFCRIWSRKQVCEETERICLLYEEKSHLSCDAFLVKKIVLDYLETLNGKHGFIFSE